ncbi:phosphatidylinositol transfer protein 3-like [Trifolium pratense]|uniref:phosphatidylinositol transfer protein 3-like n=1 Tax=Trifolium pratense TaxID=57577 RepID=UPI001E697C5E|nr:phosphatidylinositol transfer protein 3-like [Trifolium pratense]XP_045803363.1 phosphatidylinositol transfer protein 3-like [Trifolium pratense]XP_045803364.1 phosphatidylinositol transfer protein 3-like [Trifolium pratense]XP_045803365.1 phosphatidylinositol transfer protein 3-like [Trifolium pratense]
MSEDLKKTACNGQEKMLAVSLSQEQQKKIIEVRKLLGTLSDKESVYCSDASISRYLKSQNWNVKKASQMLKQSLKWRKEYKPEEIRWDEVSNEAETGKIYRPNYFDKHGRPVLIMRTNRQKSKTLKEEIKHFVYCMENAILNLPPHQEQVIWLVDFHGFNLSNVSFKMTREVSHILQKYYPQRLGLAIMYDAPGIFQPFFAMVKVLLEQESYNKVKFVYSNDQNTKKIMEGLFDMDQLEPAFGGTDDTEFDINKYAKRMREEDNKMHSLWTKANPLSPVSQNVPSESVGLETDSNASNNDKISSSSIPNPDKYILVNRQDKNAVALA